MTKKDNQGVHLQARLNRSRPDLICYPAPTEEPERDRARRFVASRAEDADDAKLLIEMLGILPGQDGEVLP